MLVIGRKVGERVKVGNAMVQVLSARGEYVHLGIEAPSEIRIHRTELLGECEVCHTVESPPTRDGRILCESCRGL